MAFSLFFWRKQAQATSLQPPPQPAEPVASAPGMPFVRNQAQPSTHPRLARMAELLQQLPQPPNTAPHAPLGAASTGAAEQTLPAAHTVAPPSEAPPALPASRPTLPSAPAWRPTPVAVQPPEPAITVPEPVVEHTEVSISESERVPAQEAHSEERPQVQAIFVETPAQQPHEVIHAPALHPTVPAAPVERPFVEAPVVQPARVVVVQPVLTEQRELVEPDLNQRATNAFYAADGSVFWTAGELGDGLIHLSDDSFAHHVSASHNDFANWLDGCFTGDTRMIGTLIRGLDRQGMIRLFLRLQRPPAPRVPVPHADEPHFDEKQPVVWDWSPAGSVEKTSVLHELEDALKAAELIATHDVGAAREAFIHVRTRVWSELSDEERGTILPKMRAAYDRLRTYH